MTEEIKPALTEEEWTAHRADRGDLIIRASGLSDVVLTDGGDTVVVEPAAIPAVMAALNGALLNDDPRKATWDDVRILNEAAQLSREGRALDAKWAEYFDHMAARIAALLPPEGA